VDNALALYIADFADLVVFDKVSDFGKVDKVYNRLNYADQVGNVGDMTDLTVGRYMRPYQCTHQKSK